MKASSLMILLEAAIKVAGDCDVSAHIVDRDDVRGIDGIDIEENDKTAPRVDGAITLRLEQ